MRAFFHCTYSSYVHSNIQNVSNLADAESKAQICLMSESNRTGASDVFLCAFTPDLRLWALSKILDPRSQDDRVMDGKHPKALPLVAPSSMVSLAVLCSHDYQYIPATCGGHGHLRPM